MAKTNVRRSDRGPGADYLNTQRGTDEAINERLRAEGETDKLDPQTANSESRTEHKPDDFTKKAGRSKH